MSGVYCATGGYTHWHIDDATAEAVRLSLRNIHAVPYKCEACEHYHLHVSPQPNEMYAA